MPVSAHYLIGKDGTIYPLLHDQLRAWHAGGFKWGTITDINSISIGIELDNNGKEPFPSIQIDSLISLLNVLKVRYKIPTVNFGGMQMWHQSVNVIPIHCFHGNIWQVKVLVFGMMKR